MSVHNQEPYSRSDTLPRWYAYCSCGVCGPLRSTRLLAVLDEGAHADVCSATKAAA